MKAGDRCREHFKGDRCTKAAGHASDLAIATDKEHTGKFVSWVGAGDRKMQLSAVKHPSRRAERRLDRWIDRVRADPGSVPRQQRAGVINFLGHLSQLPNRAAK